jgi:hypothetical protein
MVDGSYQGPTVQALYYNKAKTVMFYSSPARALRGEGARLEVLYCTVYLEGWSYSSTIIYYRVVPMAPNCRVQYNTTEVTTPFSAPRCPYSYSNYKR